MPRSKLGERFLIKFKFQALVSDKFLIRIGLLKLAAYSCYHFLGFLLTGLKIFIIDIFLLEKIDNC